jgi:hypothetical protein
MKTRVENKINISHNYGVTPLPPTFFRLVRQRVLPYIEVNVVYGLHPHFVYTVTRCKCVPSKHNSVFINKMKIFTAEITDLTSEIYSKHLTPWLNSFAPTPIR